MDAVESEVWLSSGPVVAVGDFNTNDRQPNYWRLRRLLRDAYRDAGRGFGLTFPNTGWWGKPLPVPPFLRLDYIFHSPDLVATRAWTASSPSSDHRAVVADLVITGAPHSASRSAGPQAAVHSGEWRETPVRNLLQIMNRDLMEERDDR